MKLWSMKNILKCDDIDKIFTIIFKDANHEYEIKNHLFWSL